LVEGVKDVGDVLIDVLRFLERPTQTIKSHLESIVVPAQTAHRNLGQVATQAQRTGASVEAGALAGSAALRVMAGAALIGLSAVLALGKAWDGIKATARETFGVGVGAAAAGMPVREFSAVSQALYTHGNVPQEETQQWMAGFGQIQQQIELGHLDPRVGSVGWSRAHLSYTDTPEEAYRKLALRYASISEKRAIAEASDLGLSRRAALSLHRQGPNFEANVATARSTAVTDKDVKAATELTQAIAQLDTQFTQLHREMTTDLTPALAATLHGITGFVIGLRGLTLLIEALAILPKDLIEGKMGEWEKWFEKSWDKIAKSIPTTTSGNSPITPQNESISPSLITPGANWLEDVSKAEGTFGPNGINYDAIYGNGKYGTPSKPVSQMTLAEVSAYQDQLRPRTGALNTSAVGGFQIEGSTLKDAEKALGLDPNKTIFNADTQRKIAAWVRVHQGWPAWQGFLTHPDLQRAAEQDFSSRVAQSSVPSQTAATKSPPSIATDPGYNGAGPPLNLPSIVVPAQRGNLQQTAPATHPPVKQSNNTINFGDVNVHTAATDGPGTGAAVVAAINKNLYVAQANQGLV
jgi:hypothetical protein